MSDGNAAGDWDKANDIAVNPDYYENATVNQNGYNAKIQYWIIAAPNGDACIEDSTRLPGMRTEASTRQVKKSPIRSCERPMASGRKRTISYNNNNPFTMSFKNIIGCQGIMAADYV